MSCNCSKNSYRTKKQMIELAQNYFSSKKIPVQVYEETTSEGIKIYNFEPLNYENKIRNIVVIIDK